MNLNNWHILIVGIILILFNGCKSESLNEVDESIFHGELKSGVDILNYTEFLPLKGEAIKLYYYLPEKFTNDSRIVFVFHGDERNAKDYRGAWINKATQYNFMVVVPEFSETNFPGGDRYNLGNVFVDGDNPSASTLNPEAEWTYSIIEPLFDFVKQKVANASESYLVFGHSAGAQFAHRFVMFKPDARFDMVVASASGWYTAVDLDTNFPYGFKNCPLDEINLSNLFSEKIIIQVGDLDNDPNSAGLRHNEFADVQGLNRLDRSKYFFENSRQLATKSSMAFNWKYIEIKDLGHDYKVASSKAADLMFSDQ